MTIIAKFALVALLGITLTPFQPQVPTAASASSVIVIGSFSGSVGSLAGM